MTGTHVVGECPELEWGGRAEKQEEKEKGDDQGRRKRMSLEVSFVTLTFTNSVPYMLIKGLA